MKRLKIFSAVWLIIAHLQLEIAPVMERTRPAYAREYINPFWNKEYVFPSYQCPGNEQYSWPKGKMPRAWWIKYCCNDFYRIIVFFVLTMVCLQYSFLLGRVAAIFFLYQVIDHLLLWYNYRSTQWHYYLMNGAIVIAIIFLFIPEKEKAKVVSLK